MKVEKLSLRNFRNISDTNFLPGPGINFIIGKNGQGKTSFLEALGYLSTLRSFRDADIPEVIEHGNARAEIHCDLRSSDWSTRLKVEFVRERPKKTAFINEKAYRSSTLYLSQRFGQSELGFHSVVFNPGDHDLVRGSPNIRRSYLDRVLAAEDLEYLRVLQKYRHTLDQKNALLKAESRASRELLFGFTEPLARSAAFLVRRRLEWAARLVKPLYNTASKIAPPQPFLRLVYISNWSPEITALSLSNNKLGEVHFAGQHALPSLETLEQAFLEKQSSLEAAEWRLGHSLVGPHRDDWAFYLGSQPLAGHGSQGEIRSSLLALKLCEVELFREATGHSPIFLLDDFSSELDRDRRTFLLDFLMEKDLQVFVTTTDESFGFSPAFRESGRFFRAADGKLDSLREHVV